MIIPNNGSFYNLTDYFIIKGSSQAQLVAQAAVFIEDTDEILGYWHIPDRSIGHFAMLLDGYKATRSDSGIDAYSKVVAYLLDRMCITYVTYK